MSKTIAIYLSNFSYETAMELLTYCQKQEYSVFATYIDFPANAPPNRAFDRMEKDLSLGYFSSILIEKKDCNLLLQSHFPQQYIIYDCKERTNSEVIA